MSEAFLANLPRFDASEAPPVSRHRSLLLGQMPADDTVATRLPADAIGTSLAPEAKQGGEESAGRVPEFAEIEIMLTALSETIERVERESRERALAVSQALASRLFPELSRLFLAEEIAHHLPAMIPSSAPAVEIRAQAELIERLRDAVERTASLSERCSVVPAAVSEDGEVRVSWEIGGLTFDFDGLLKACLAQLDSPQATIEE